MKPIKQFLSLLRISHWTKAAFVLLGVFYSAALQFLPSALWAALSFCLISSAVYIYNDLQDRAKDRLHPHKYKRPLASGYFSVTFALVTFGCLLCAGLLIAWLISTKLMALAGIYLLINLAYNHFLKTVPICDVLCIASGFMIRVLAGTIGIGLPISWWLTLTATLLSLFIALCKRRLEKNMFTSNRTRAVLQKYSTSLLDTLILVTAFSSFITYFLYTLFAREESFYFLLTLPFAAIGLARFAWLTTRCFENDDPIYLFIQDNLSRLNVICFLYLTLDALFK
ncbi:MAG: decaprenyl-phosphate phosphoribosyltransferase [Tatlockia sp.]|jgi:4-hydroxybenzoate polyprenyltransferase